MPIYEVGPAKPYATIADAMAVIAALPQPLTVYQQIEVSEGLALEDVVIPPAIQPTALAPLQIVNSELDRPAVDDVVLDKPHVKFSGFLVKGNVSGGQDGQLFSENKVEGQVHFQGDGLTPMAIKIYNNALYPQDADALVVRDIPGQVRVFFNSILSRTDGSLPFYGARFENSDLLVRFNIFAAKGSQFCKAAYLRPGTAAFDSDRNIFITYLSATFGTYGDGVTEVEVANLTDWQAKTAGDVQSMFTDPKFRCLAADPGINLDVANTSPAVAKGDYENDIPIDIDKTRRPTLLGGPNQSTTIGAYEEAQIITESGKIRVLELIGGVNMNSVTKVAVGQIGTISAIEYLRPQTPSSLDPDLQDRIYMTRIAHRYVDGITAIFDCFLGPTPEMTERLLDENIHVMEEVGLFTEDELLFMRRTLYRIPFDPLSVLSIRLKFGIAVGPCRDILIEPGPVLVVVAEAVP